MSHHVRAYRRTGTVDGIEIHKKPSLKEIPDIYPGSTEVLVMHEVPYFEGSVFIARTPSGETAAVLLGDSDADFAYIDQVESFQSGYGSKIVKAFEKWAKKRGAMHVHLNSTAGAYAFWVKMGYHPECHVFDGSYRECDMAKDL